MPVSSKIHYNGCINHRPVNIKQLSPAKKTLKNVSLFCIFFFLKVISFGMCFVFYPTVHYFENEGNVFSHGLYKILYTLIKWEHVDGF